MLSGGPLCSNFIHDFQSGLFLIFSVSETGDVPKHQQGTGCMSDTQKWWNGKAYWDCQNILEDTWTCGGWLWLLCCRRSASSTWRLPSWGSVVTIPPSHISLNPSTSQTSGSASRQSRGWLTTKATPGTGNIFFLFFFSHFNDTGCRSALVAYLFDWFRLCVSENVISQRL